MNNQKTSSIRAIAKRLYNLSKIKNTPIDHNDLTDASNKIISEANSLNRSMLTKTDIKNIQYIIDCFKMDDGYFHAVPDVQLERIERRLKLLAKISMMTNYEKEI